MGDKEIDENLLRQIMREWTRQEYTCPCPDGFWVRSTWTTRRLPYPDLASLVRHLEGDHGYAGKYAKSGKAKRRAL